MTTTGDVRNARDMYERHLAEHKCIVGDGCPTRLQLWRTYCGGRFRVAARWNEGRLPAEVLKMGRFSRGTIRSAIYWHPDNVLV